jgi:UDP-glucose 4-epimerase
MLEGKTILVTGGTGTMGQMLVRRLLAGELGTPRKLIVFSRDETKQHSMRLAYRDNLVATDEIIFRNFTNALEFRIGDVRDYASVCSAIRNADIVINAAALKQVPTCEYFPTEAILTNCLGPANIVRAIEEHGYPVDTVVAVSTDKACKPVNVMGMTKAIQERVFTAANVLVPETRFISVRYGNVLASRGSVIPLFRDQIKRGGPVTVTDPEMTRFLLGLDQAVDAVFAAIKHARRGETYVPNAPSASVMNIAKALIGDRRIKIEITGIRPGEKLHEIMISEEEANRCVKRGEYYCILPMLPELQHAEEQEPMAITREFSSADEVLDLMETSKLLEESGLMVETASAEQTAASSISEAKQQ